MKPLALTLCSSLLVLTSSCASSLALSPQPFEQGIKAGVQPDDPKDADGVVVHTEERWLVVGAGGNPFMDHQVHRVVRVLTEKGFEAASAHFYVPPKGELRDFKARTILKDGTVVEVDPKSVVADEAQFGKVRVGTRSFQYPRVEVGAVLETTYLVRHKGIWGSTSDVPAEEWPVRSYDLEIVLDQYAQPDFLLQNLNVPLDYKKQGQTQTIKMHLSDLAASSREPLRPHARERQPWWICRIISFKTPAYLWNVSASWGDTADGGTSKLLLKGEGADDAPALPATVRCAGDRGCIVDAVLDALVDAVAFVGFDVAIEDRAMKDIVASKVADDDEKALVAYAMLQKAGVDVRVAAMARTDTWKVEETLPAGAWLNHLLLYLPPTSSEPALWIDPSCEHCKRGVLPSWSRGGRAVVYEVGSSQTSNKPDIKARTFVDVAGAADVQEKHVRSLVAVVDDHGDAVFDVVQDAYGKDAVEHYVDSRDVDDAENLKATERAIAKRAPTATVLDAKQWRCDRKAGACHASAQWKHVGFVTVDGDDWLVPLRALHSYDEDEALAARERTLPIVINDEDAYEETLRLRLPADREVAELPKPVDIETTTLVMHAEARRDGDDIVVARRWRYKPGRYPKEAWAAHRAAFVTSQSLGDVLLRAKKKQAP